MNSPATVVRTRQRVFAPVIQDCLSRITYDTDGWAQQLRLPVSRSVIVDPLAQGVPHFFNRWWHVSRCRQSAAWWDRSSSDGLPSGPQLRQVLVEGS